MTYFQKRKYHCNEQCSYDGNDIDHDVHKNIYWEITDSQGGPKKIKIMILPNRKQIITRTCSPGSVRFWQILGCLLLMVRKLNGINIET